MSNCEDIYVMSPDINSEAIRLTHGGGDAGAARSLRQQLPGLVAQQEADRFHEQPERSAGNICHEC